MCRRRSIERFRRRSDLGESIATNAWPNCRPSRRGRPYRRLGTRPPRTRRAGQGSNRSRQRSAGTSRRCCTSRPNAARRACRRCGSRCTSSSPATPARARQPSPASSGDCSRGTACSERATSSRSGGATSSAGISGRRRSRPDEKLDEALDGVLFVDEAYALDRGGAPRATPTATRQIETILKRMEDARDRLVVVVGRLPGGDGPIPRHEPRTQEPVHAVPALRRLRPGRSSSRSSCRSPTASTTACRPRRWRVWKAWSATMHAGRDESFGNARDVRTLFESAVGRQAVRLASVGPAGDAG